MAADRYLNRGRVTRTVLREAAETAGDVATSAAQAVVPTAEELARETVEYVEVLGDEVGDWIATKIDGRQDDVVFYLMLTIMVLGTALFLWRTIGRSRTAAPF